jgi:tol-pal system protein YbgF
MMKRRAALTLAGMTALLCACQQPVKEDDPYAVRVRQVEARLDRMDQLSKNQGNQGLSLSQRLDDLQSQLQQMRGEVEVLQHSEDLDKKQQRDLYQDLDKRLQKLEMGLGAATAVPPPATTPVPTAATVSAPATPAAGAAEEGLYQKNLKLLQQARFADAIKGFKSFLKQYPNSTLAGNAQFWMGEAYYQNNDFDTALVSFKKVLKDYPASNKVADAMAKVGYCQYELQQWKSARETLNAVVQKYPGSSAAKLAADGLQRMQNEGH